MWPGAGARVGCGGLGCAAEGGELCWGQDRGDYDEAVAVEGGEEGGGWWQGTHCCCCYDCLLILYVVRK